MENSPDLCMEIDHQNYGNWYGKFYGNWAMEIGWGSAGPIMEIGPILGQFP